jgi:hypothetical protein
MGTRLTIVEVYEHARSDKPPVVGFDQERTGYITPAPVIEERDAE